MAFVKLIKLESLNAMQIVISKSDCGEIKNPIFYGPNCTDYEVKIKELFNEIRIDSHYISDEQYLVCEEFQKRLLLEDELQKYLEETLKKYFAG